MFLEGQDGRKINLLQIGIINVGEDPKTVEFYDKNLDIMNKDINIMKQNKKQQIDFLLLKMSFL